MKQGMKPSMAGACRMTPMFINYNKK